MIDLLNRYYIPIHVTNEKHIESGDASPAEKAERARIMREVFRTGYNNPVRASDAAFYVLEPTGHINDALLLPDCLNNDEVIKMLEEVRTKLKVPAAKAPVVAPRPQSAPPKTPADAIVLHLTARYVPAGGSWKLLPSEDWLVLDKSQWSKLTPAKDAKVGDSWNIDSTVVEYVLSNFYPPSSNRDPKTNKITDPQMKATVISAADGRVRIRLDSTLKMKHRFLPVQDDNNHVEAKIVGYLDWDLAKQAISDIRMVTENADYVKDNGKDGFGIAARLVR